jgi:hypothetical protein
MVLTSGVVVPLGAPALVVPALVVPVGVVPVGVVPVGVVPDGVAAGEDDEPQPTSATANNADTAIAATWAPRRRYLIIEVSSYSNS